MYKLICHPTFITRLVKTNIRILNLQWSLSLQMKLKTFHRNEYSARPSTNVNARGFFSRSWRKQDRNILLWSEGLGLVSRTITEWNYQLRWLLRQFHDKDVSGEWNNGVVWESRLDLKSYIKIRKEWGSVFHLNIGICRHRTEENSGIRREDHAFRVYRYFSSLDIPQIPYCTLVAWIDEELIAICTHESLHI